MVAVPPASALIKIARVGRAMPTLRDLTYSVVIDEPKTTPVRLFTPRKSWNYSSGMTHAATPHAYRIGFVNNAKDWSPQEVVVYDDGYLKAGTAATGSSVFSIQKNGAQFLT